MKAHRLHRPSHPRTLPPLQPTLAVSCCPHLFEQRRIDYSVPAGLTIAKIVEVIQPDPLLRTHGVAFLGEQAVERQHWHRVRPKPGTYLSIRLTPPYAALPYREVVGGEIYWRALFALSHGPITISELKIGETPLSNFQDVAWEFHRGYWQLPDAGSFEAGSGSFPGEPRARRPKHAAEWGSGYPTLCELHRLKYLHEVFVAVDGSAGGITMAVVARRRRGVQPCLSWEH
ncbi:MAG: hypothetical protein HWD60_00715 [Defluviicoccus sp.]|nr:MAG: hypothetical protein HWD60_00715 [Defluviicoccus sp.]